MACLWKRGKTYYARYYLGGKQKAVCLRTKSYRIAKDKLRELESRLVGNLDITLPTRTPIAKVVAAYIAHIQITKTKSSVTIDMYYLRDLFEPILPALCRSQRSAHREQCQQRDRTDSYIEANYFECITTKQIASFISHRMRSRRLAPKTCNHYRGILSRIFNWATSQYGICMPQDVNPAAKVERYRERAHRIRFLTIPQIDEQLVALGGNPILRTMVATYIYTGLRRAELLWLACDDIDLSAGRFGAVYVQPKTINGEYWEPKTKSNRVVPVSSMLRSFLERYQPSPVKGNWYFPSPMGRRWDPDNFSELLRKVNRQAGLPWSCLDFRHTFGSQLAMKGESRYKISALMGNSPEICRRHYATLMPESLINSVEFRSPPTGTVVRSDIHIIG